MTVSSSKSPGRPGVSFEQYEVAYRELTGLDEQAPSQRQIRRYLGTGSNTTLSAYRQRIAEQRTEAGIAPEPGSLDGKLLTSVTQLVSQLAIEAAQIADDRVDEIEAAASQRIQIAESTMEKRLRDTDLLEHRAKTAETSLADARKEIDRLNKALATTDKDRQSVTVELATAKQSLTDTARQLTERTQILQGLRSECDELKNGNDTLTKQLTRSESALTRLQQAHSKIDARCQSLVTQLEDRQVVIAQCHADHATLNDELDTAKQAIESMTTQLDDQKQSNATLTITNAELGAELRSERAQFQDSANRLTAELDSKGALLESLQEAFMALVRTHDNSPKT